MLAQTKTLPRVLSFSEAKYYVFSVAFISAAVFFPWLAHQFQLAGARFLPMHFFIIIAGFLFGWRIGVAVGVLSPLMSYSITQMPSVAILPEVILELAVYGLVTGLLRERNLHIGLALVGAMFLGRLARLFFVLAWGLETDPFFYFQISWPGIVLQLASIPLIIYLLQKFVFEKNATKI